MIEITLYGVKAVVDGEYHEAEPMTMVDPGCGEDFILTEVWIFGVNVVKELTVEAKDKIRMAALDAIRAAGAETFEDYGPGFQPKEVDE